MRGEIHSSFTKITIHTAKCDICNKHNTGEMNRCDKCGRQCCQTCWDRPGFDPRHKMHNKDTVAYKGPVAAPLPPIVGKNAEKEAKKPEEKKRRRSSMPAGDAAKSAGSPSLSDASTSITEDGRGSDSKRPRHITDPVTDDEILAGEMLPQVAEDLDNASNSNVKAQYSPEPLPKKATTEKEIKTPIHLSEDHRGLDAIVQAADLLNRSSSASASKMAPPARIPLPDTPDNHSKAAKARLEKNELSGFKPKEHAGRQPSAASIAASAMTPPARIPLPATPDSYEAAARAYSEKTWSSFPKHQSIQRAHPLITPTAASAMTPPARIPLPSTPGSNTPNVATNARPRFSMPNYAVEATYRREENSISPKQSEPTMKFFRNGQQVQQEGASKQVLDGQEEGRDERGGFRWADYDLDRDSDSGDGEHGETQEL